MKVLTPMYHFPFPRNPLEKNCIRIIKVFPTLIYISYIFFSFLGVLVFHEKKEFCNQNSNLDGKTKTNFFSGKTAKKYMCLFSKHFCRWKVSRGTLWGFACAPSQSSGRCCHPICLSGSKHINGKRREQPALQFDH